MGKDEGAVLMLRRLLMLLLKEETPGKNDLNGRTAEIINLQNIRFTPCRLVYFVYTTSSKIKVSVDKIVNINCFRKLRNFRF